MMLPLIRFSSLACGLAVGLSSFADADDAVQQKFGAWTVTIQPGVRGSSPHDVQESPIRLVSQQESTPADATDAFPAPPAPHSPDAAPAFGIAGQTPAGIPAQVSLVQLYSQVYNTIPFSRAEYNANPSYRHDATMEFLFGQLRPMTINRSTTIIKQRSGGGMPYGGGSPFYSPYGFNSYYYPFYNNGFYWTYNLW